MVNKLLERQRTRSGRRTAAAYDHNALRQDEWWLSDLAAKLQMPMETLHRWRKVGWVTSRKVTEAGGKWTLFANETELSRLRELRAYRRGWGETKTPSRLTTPNISDR